MKPKEDFLKFQIVAVEDGFAYDVTVTDEDATIGDYIRLFDLFLDEKVAPCLGCDLCCSQRIPLTLPDIYTYAGKEPSSIAAFLAEKTELRRNGGAVDIKLAQNDDGSCVFLDRSEQRCRDHPRRSLVCHTYICLPQTERAKRLRESLINSGEDALIGEVYRLGILSDAEGAANYRPNPSWQGKTFEEIRLKDVLPPSVFQSLL